MTTRWREREHAHYVTSETIGDMFLLRTNVFSLRLQIEEFNWRRQQHHEITEIKIK